VGYDGEGDLKTIGSEDQSGNDVETDRGEGANAAAAKAKAKREGGLG
jgi:hypothetical protein